MAEVGGWGGRGGALGGAGAVIADNGINSQLDNIQAQNFYLAFDFLEDKDAPEGKAKRYYLAMHCAE